MLINIEYALLQKVIFCVALEIQALWATLFKCQWHDVLTVLLKLALVSSIYLVFTNYWIIPITSIQTICFVYFSGFFEISIINRGDMQCKFGLPDLSDSSNEIQFDFSWPQIF